MIPPFDFPEVTELFGHLLGSILEESDRGAVIIGATHVDDFLAKYIKGALPTHNKEYERKLFNYPGPLSSFSARIELAYSFRYINKSLYDALTELRKVRNNAAHTSQPFSLKLFEEKMEKAYRIGPNFPTFIREQATRALIHSKLETIKQYFEENNIPQDLQNKHFENFRTNKEIASRLEEQIPHWELIFGVTFLCGYLTYERTRLVKLTNIAATWSAFNDKA